MVNTLQSVPRRPVDKVMTWEAAVAWRASAPSPLVFTNGVFDLLHPGHLEVLDRARREGAALVVGLNSDASVRRNKGKADGPPRPINCEEDRAFVLAALRCVDAVVIFDEDEPRDLISSILPQILVKGRDWAHYVSGREIVETNGGKVVLADMVEGRSTTNTIGRILGSVPSAE